MSGSKNNLKHINKISKKQENNFEEIIQDAFQRNKKK